MPEPARLPWAWAVASGVLYFLGFVGFGLWPLIFVFLVPLMTATRQRSARASFFLGWLAGTVAMWGGYYWVVHLLQTFAHLDLHWAVLGFFLLTAYQGLAWGIVALFEHQARTHWRIPTAISLTMAVIAIEAWYPFLFPNYAGNTLYVVPRLTQHVELFGMAGLSVLVGGVNGALADAVAAAREGRRMHRPLAEASALLAVVALYGTIRMYQVDLLVQRSPTIEVALIQANLGARDKVGKRSEFIRRHQEMTRAAYDAHPDLDLVVWPESSYNRFLPRDRTELAYVNGNIPVPLLFGAISGDIRGEEREVFNTAVLTSSTGALASRFDKVRLLTFGESLPFVETFPQIKEWFPRSASFTRGRTFEHLRLGPYRLLPMICYEDIIPSFVRTMWNRAGPADVLVNITNDSWYGDSHEPLTHLALATFRSIETRRAMIRSTNTGISAIVDPVGRIAERTGQWTRETLVARVPVIRDDSTSLHMRWGDFLGWVGLLFCLFTAVRVWRAR